MAKVFSCLCAILFIFFSPLANADEFALKDQEVLKLKNYELNLQNIHLQIEVLKRDLSQLQQDRDGFLTTLYKNYEKDKAWKIDLEKGVWFNSAMAPEAPPMQNNKPAKQAE